MTSLKYSANKQAARFDLKQAFRQNLVPSIFMLLVAAKDFVFNALTALSNLLYQTTVPGAAYSKEEIRRIILSVLTSSESATTIQFDCVLYGVLFALTGFYIMRRRNVNFFYSLPVDRATLLKNRVTASLSCIAGIYFIVILADCIINIAFLHHTAYIIQLSLALYAESLVYTLVSYMIVTIGIFSCYTLVEGLFFSAGLLALPSVVILTVDHLLASLLNGYARNVRDIFDVYTIYGNGPIDFEKTNLLIQLANFNPLFFVKRIGSGEMRDNIFTLADNNSQLLYSYDTAQLADYKPEYTLPDIRYILPILIWAVVFAAGMLLAKHLFIHRRAENTELHASNKAATMLFTLEAGFAGVMCAAYFTMRMDLPAAVKILMTLVIFIAVCYITAAICKRKAIFDAKTYLVPAAVGACIAVFGVILSGGMFGYATYAPAPEQVECVAVNAGGLFDSLMNEDLSNNVYDTFISIVDNGEENGAGIFSGEDIPTVEALQKTVSEKAKPSNREEIYFIYKLKNGKLIYRKYCIDDIDTMYRMLSLADTASYRQQVKNYLLGGTEKDDFVEKIHSMNLELADFVPEDYLYSSDRNDALTYKLTKEVFSKGFVTIGNSLSMDYTELKTIDNTEELRKALYEDLTSMTAEQRFQPTEKELCMLTFSSYDPNVMEDEDESALMDSASQFANFDMSQSYRVYPSMKKTVAYLKKQGVLTEGFAYFKEMPVKAYTAKISKLTEIDIYALPSFGSYIFQSAFQMIEDTTGMEEFYDDSFMDDPQKIYGNEITDANAIKALMEASRPYSFISYDDYIVCFEFQNDKKEHYYRTMLIRADEMPLQSNGKTA